MRKGIGSYTGASADNAVESSPALEVWIGIGHGDWKEVTQL